MKRQVLILLVLHIASIQALFPKSTAIGPIDYVKSLINYCSGKPNIDFCSLDQVEFGLKYLFEFQKKLEETIEREKQELIKKEKEKKIKQRKKVILQHKYNKMAQAHFLDRHF